MRSSNYLRQAKRRQNRVPELETKIYFEPGDQICGKDTLAELLSVDVTSIERWIRDGMPVEQRGDQLHEWIFVIDKVRAWQQEYLDSED